MARSFSVTTTAVGTSTPLIHDFESKRPSSPSAAGIAQALVLRSSAMPHVLRSAASAEGSSGRSRAMRSTRSRAYVDMGSMAAVITGKNSRSPSPPR